MLATWLPSWSPRRKLVLLLSVAIGFILYQSWRIAALSRRPTLDLDSPSPSSSIFPNKIWYKLGPKGLSHDAQKWTKSCTELNPNYHAEFLTDTSADQWVQEKYAHRPDILESYLGLSVPILKADFLRYLLLYEEGGVWFDLDVSCDVPIDDWVPTHYQSNTSLLVGWEFDMGWGYQIIHQLESWSLAAKPKLPHMMVAIEEISQDLHRIASEKQTTIAGVTLSMVGDVVDFTGPRRLTRSIFKEVQRALGLEDTEFTPLEKSTWFLREPKLLGDVLILPGFSFSSSTNTYEGAEAVGPSLVTHHYAGSWKNDHGGEQ